jgi:D-alanyl-lipoteichoic acid acyltransferase DltB (MBOAT superfamily)
VLFNSYVFIFCFLPVVLAGYAILRGAANPLLPIGWLVLASLFYYAWWRPEFLLWLLFSVTVNFGLGKLIIDGNLSQIQSRAVMIGGIVFNLCLLGYFKYTGFFLANINGVFGAHWTVPSIVLPIGISFITFQKIAFLVDAHRGLVRDFTLLNYAFFVSFFPQLIAGPITHHSEVMPQIAPALRRDLAADLAVGLSIFVVGLFKKVVVADSLAVYADAGYAMVRAGHPLDTASAWITVLSYSFQLYYDFSGYCDMAVGLARMFGIRLPVNFYSPYKAASIIDFWRRWHMTLSRFLRDYLYIPLGGNRRGPMRRYLNLGIVMLLGGLWHGANWTFVVWGCVHGLLLALNHAWHELPCGRHPLLNGPAARGFAVLATFVAVTLAWVPFRADNLTDALTMVGYLWPTTSDPHGFPSILRFLDVQFLDLKGFYRTFMEWFRPRELWPVVLPPDYLATAVRPLGPFLLWVSIATFALPNTYQIFRRFDPALGLPKEDPPRGALSRLDRRVAAVIAGMLVLSILRLSHVSPFLYYQF